MNVKPISKRGHSAIVEYTDQGKVKRVIIPSETIVGGIVDDAVIELGIPYGVEWSKLVKPQATPELLEENLRRVGIWTGDDALRDAGKVLGAIQATYQIDLGTILRIAKKEVK